MFYRKGIAMVWVVGFLWKLVRSRLALPFLAIVVAGHCWMTFRPKPFPLDERRSELADEVAGKLADALPVPAAGRPTLTAAPFERDPTGTVTEAVQRAIDRVNRYAVQPASFTQNVFAEMGMREELSPEHAAMAAADDLKTEYLLAGRVEKLSARTDMDEATVTAVLVPTGLPECAVPLSVQVVHDHAATASQSGTETKAWLTHLVNWLMLAVLLPVAAAPAFMHGLKLRSNAFNAGILLALTFAGGIAAFAMLGFRLDTAISAALLIAAVTVALSYNWLILTKLEELTA